MMSCNLNHLTCMWPSLAAGPHDTMIQQNQNMCTKDYSVTTCSIWNRFASRQLRTSESYRIPQVSKCSRYHLTCWVWRWPLTLVQTRGNLTWMLGVWVSYMHTCGVDVCTCFEYVTLLSGLNTLPSSMTAVTAKTTPLSPWKQCDNNTTLPLCSGILISYQHCLLLFIFHFILSYHVSPTLDLVPSCTDTACELNPAWVLLN